MKKAVLTFLCLLCVISLAACSADQATSSADEADSAAIGGNERTSATEATPAGSGEAEYKADLNGDGRQETLRFVLSKHPNGLIKGFVVEYCSADGQKKDSFDLDRIYSAYPESDRSADPLFGDNWADCDPEESSCVHQQIRVYANDSGYIALNYYFLMDGQSCEYIVLSVRNEKLVIAQHLIDPGYTSGVGLYEARTYYTKGDFLLEYEPGYYNGREIGDDVNFESLDVGNAYLAALNEAMAPYGYRYKNDDHREIGAVCGSVIEGNGAKEIYSFTTG